VFGKEVGLRLLPSFYLWAKGGVKFSWRMTAKLGRKNRNILYAQYVQREKQ